MPVLALIQTVLALVPSIIDDVAKVSALFATASTAIDNAQANGGAVTADDWAKLNALFQADLAQLGKDAGVSA
jgi:hypothetical protein